MKTLSTAEILLNRFWSKVDRRESDKCWLWTGALSDGYGSFWVGGRSQQAHRLAYYFTTGELPKSPYAVLHRCNNRPCVNPDHLYKGTASDNVRDLMNTGYRPSGKPRKLTDEQINEVIKLNIEGMYQRDIARIMNVSQWTIWNTLNNIEWA